VRSIKEEALSRLIHPQRGGMMELSAEQRRAVENGEAVPITVAETACVLLRADLYERVKAMLEIAEAYPLIDEAVREGCEAPGMADYDHDAELTHP
jgi:hypothetical protein